MVRGRSDLHEPHTPASAAGEAPIIHAGSCMLVCPLAAGNLPAHLHLANPHHDSRDRRPVTPRSDGAPGTELLPRCTAPSVVMRLAPFRRCSGLGDGGGVGTLSAAAATSLPAGDNRNSFGNLAEATDVCYGGFLCAHGSPMAWQQQQHDLI